MATDHEQGGASVIDLPDDSLNESITFYNNNKQIFHIPRTKITGIKTLELILLAYQLERLFDHHIRGI